jgi:NADPH:quinone reductase-like Zn-dependent oxidoreductase
LPCRYVLLRQGARVENEGIRVYDRCFCEKRGANERKQFAKAAGAKVIATTSSAEKVELVKKMGADHVLNYREDKDWGNTAKGLTPNNDGVDHVIEVGGPETLGHSLNAIKYGGLVSLIGVLTGFEPKESALEALYRVCVLRGVMIGSRSQFQDMVKAIEVNDLHPIISDEIFAFEKAKDAYEYQVSSSGKFDLC